jgi:hypothetical protein
MKNRNQEANSRNGSESKDAAPEVGVRIGAFPNVGIET